MRANLRQPKKHGVGRIRKQKRACAIAMMMVCSMPPAYCSTGRAIVWGTYWLHILDEAGASRHDGMITVLFIMQSMEVLAGTFSEGRYRDSSLMVSKIMPASAALFGTTNAPSESAPRRVTFKVYRFFSSSAIETVTLKDLQVN